MFLEAGINSYLSKEKKTGEEIFNIKQLQKQILSTSSKIKILNKIIEESTKLTDEDEEKVNMVKRWRYEAKVWSNELVSFPSYHPRWNFLWKDLAIDKWNPCC